MRTSSMRDDFMNLGLFILPAGHHLSAWRLPEQTAEATDFEHIARIARTAEAAKLDALFLADVDGSWGSRWETMARDPGTMFLEPLTLLSALAAITSRIGLIGSASTTYNEPYHLARKFASLDHISHGRAAWNIVTSFMPHNAANFGIERYPDHEERYRAADEYMSVVKGLWDSWGDGAVVRDKVTGQYLDLGKLKILDHKGPYFTSKGPLTMPRSPQGHPVLVQAGSSEDGREFASSHAEVIFTVQSVIEEAISPSLAISLTWAKIHINLSLSSNIPSIQLLLSLQQKDSMMQTT